MGWSCGFDSNWNRDIGYGVPATCDFPGCGADIDRGLAYVCGGEPRGGEEGCGLYFCDEHLVGGDPGQKCDRCYAGQSPFAATPDTREWIEWKLTDESWATWRGENPEKVAGMQAAVSNNSV